MKLCPQMNILSALKNNMDDYLEENNENENVENITFEDADSCLNTLTNFFAQKEECANEIQKIF